MKFFKYILILIVVVYGIFFFLNKSDNEVEIVGNETDLVPIELCFATFGNPDKNDLYDKYTLRLKMEGEKREIASGELKFLPAEKDSKVGKFTGTAGEVNKTMMARVAYLWWDTLAEGMNITEELSIIFGEGTASIGLGEMIDRGDGVYVYKDKENINYSLNLSDISCAILSERENVEDYLRENIVTLSPVDAVLGGTWYVGPIFIDVENNSGWVTYEDGHIQEKRDFVYNVDNDNKVVSLIIN